MYNNNSVDCKIKSKPRHAITDTYLVNPSKFVHQTYCLEENGYTMSEYAKDRWIISLITITHL